MDAEKRADRLEYLRFREEKDNLTRLLGLELTMMEAEDALIAAKSKRKDCSECGRIKPAAGKGEAAIADAKAEAAHARRLYREARADARGARVT